MIDLDDTDRAILRALQADGGLNAKQVGAQVGLSQPAAWRRIRRLEEAGVIAGRRVVLDRDRLGFGVVVFLGLKLAGKGGSAWRSSNARSPRFRKCRSCSTCWGSMTTG